MWGEPFAPSHGQGQEPHPEDAWIFGARVTVAIVPLLALCAEQIGKATEASQKYASYEAHHIEECSEADIINIVIPRMNAIGNELSLVVFIFISPQKLLACGPI